MRLQETASKPMSAMQTLLLNKDQVRRLIDMRQVIGAVAKFSMIYPTLIRSSSLSAAAGLISGIATAIKETMPSVRVIGVVPALTAKYSQSWINTRSEPPFRC